MMLMRNVSKKRKSFLKKKTTGQVKEPTTKKYVLKQLSTLEDFIYLEELLMMQNKKEYILEIVTSLSLILKVIVWQLLLKIKTAE